MRQQSGELEIPVGIEAVVVVPNQVEKVENPELLPRMEKAGIAKEDIVIVMALGSHRCMTDEEMIMKVRRQVFEHYRVINSEFHDQEKLVESAWEKSTSIAWWE